MNNVIDFTKLNRKSHLTVVSLFAGAGGLDIGFENQGFKTIWANNYVYLNSILYVLNFYCHLFECPPFGVPLIAKALSAPPT